jgi:anti-sigma factor RsiW
VTCRELADFIIDYVGGTLPSDVRRTFEHHLGICPNCVNYLANYQASIALGRGVFKADDKAAAESGAPEELIAAILAARSADRLP